MVKMSSPVCPSVRHWFPARAWKGDDDDDGGVETMAVGESGIRRLALQWGAMFAC